LFNLVDKRDAAMMASPRSLMTVRTNRTPTRRQAGYQ
jgi:hypothetical protein